MAWSYPLNVMELMPTAAFRELQHEMNQWFDRDFFTRDLGYPPVTVWHDADTAVAWALLPGVDPSKVDVMVNGNLLTISGQREEVREKDGSVAHRRERAYGKFLRSIELPFSIDSNAVVAEYREGILSLTLPRIPEQKARKIQIN